MASQLESLIRGDDAIDVIAAYLDGLDADVREREATAAQLDHLPVQRHAVRVRRAVRFHLGRRRS